MLLIFILSVSPACSKNPTAAELARLNHDLYQATDHRDLSSVRRLLDKGANIEATGDNEMTPLGAAAGNGDLPMVQFLLQKGANPHAKDHSLETPLMHAAYDGHAEIVRLLLKQNLDIIAKNAALLEAAHGEPAIVIMQDSGKDPSGAIVSREQTMARLEAP